MVREVDNGNSREGTEDAIIFSQEEPECGNTV